MLVSVLCCIIFNMLLQNIRRSLFILHRMDDIVEGIVILLFSKQLWNNFTRDKNIEKYDYMKFYYIYDYWDYIFSPICYWRDLPQMFSRFVTTHFGLMQLNFPSFGSSIFLIRLDKLTSQLPLIQLISVWCYLRRCYTIHCNPLDSISSLRDTWEIPLPLLMKYHCQIILWEIVVTWKLEKEINCNVHNNVQDL